jgi:hypothetical protein
VARPLDGRHDPPLSFALHAALRHLANKLKHPTESAAGPGSSEGSSNGGPSSSGHGKGSKASKGSVGGSVGSETTFVAFEGASGRGACLPGWRCVDLGATTASSAYSTAHVSEEALLAAAGLAHRPGLSSDGLSEGFFVSGAEVEAGAMAAATSPRKGNRDWSGQGADFGAGGAVEENCDDWDDDYGDEFLEESEGGFAEAAWARPPADDAPVGQPAAALSPSPRGPEADLMRALGLLPPVDEEGADGQETSEPPGEEIGDDGTWGGVDAAGARKVSAREEEVLRSLGLWPPAAAAPAAAHAHAAATQPPPPMPTHRPTAAESPTGGTSAALAMLFGSAPPQAPNPALQPAPLDPSATLAMLFGTVSPEASNPALQPASLAPSATLAMLFGTASQQATPLPPPGPSATLAMLFGTPPPPSPLTMAAAGNYSGANFLRALGSCLCLSDPLP